MEEPAAKYECAVSRKEERSQRRTSEAAEAVRHIQRVEPFSREWVKLVAYIERLARFVAAEDELPQTMVEGILGRDEEGETLWDQGKHENAIRLVVEQCKINVLLRLLLDYKMATLGDLGKPVPVSQPLLVTRKNKTVDAGKVFAGATLLLLVRSLQHVEAVQLMDLSLFVEFVSFVLRRSAEAGTTTPQLREEYLLLRLIEAFTKHLDSINTAVLGFMRDHQMVQLFVEHVVEHKSRLPADALSSAAQSLSSLADSEDFQVQWEDHMPAATQQGCLAIEQQLGTLSAEDRAAVRPFLDLCKRIKKAQGA